jgi:MFS family permease
MPASNISGKELRRVVLAASVGNIIEWYDFYIFGSLASILAAKFFEKTHPVAAFLSTVAIFSVGFLIRPLGAFLAEFFPSRIRYTSVSVPYHIGNGWGGGLVPIVTTAAYAKAVENGSSDPLFWALVYPIAVPAIMFLIAIFVMPETRKNSIWEEGAIQAARDRARA